MSQIFRGYDDKVLVEEKRENRCFEATLLKSTVYLEIKSLRNRVFSPEKYICQRLQPFRSIYKLVGRYNVEYEHIDIYHVWP